MRILYILALLCCKTVSTSHRHRNVDECTEVAGHSCEGHDISNHPAPSAADCCVACSSHPGCNAFDWYSGPKLNGTPTCFLKTACPTLAVLANTVAGPNGAHPPPPPPPPFAGLTVLPLGDSITFGCGDSMSPACVAEGVGASCTIKESPCAACAYGYRVRLFNTLNASKPGGWMFVGTQRTGPKDCGTEGACQHEGHPGWRTTDLRNIVNSTLGSLQPDVILLHIGTNDIGRNRYATPAEAAADVSANLKTLMAELFAVMPSAHIFLASIIAMPPSCHFYSQTANLTAQEEAYNGEVPKVAAFFGASKVTFVDMKQETGLCDMKQVGSSGCCPPQLHPNGDGYSLMAKVWAKAVLAWARNSNHFATLPTLTALPQAHAV